jgi:hypothetical protein
MLIDPELVQSVFRIAAESDDPVERAAVLDRECWSDSEFRERVEALLRARDQSDDFGNSPRLGPANPSLTTCGEESSDWSALTGSLDQTAKVWDAQTGQELNGEPNPSTPRTGQTHFSADGRLLAQPGGSRVELIPFHPDAEEISYRLLLARPNYRRYLEGYNAARAANDDFAARFYLKLLPNRAASG